MNNLIPINYDNDRQTVDGRSLHEFLEVDSNYTTWFKRMTEYGFIDGTDFIPFVEESTGGRPSDNHQLTIEMAKELCMIQRTEKGKQARQYFIELEKKWNSPEAIFARALKMADKKLLSLQSTIDEMKPKAEFFDAVADSKSAIEMSQAAKVLNYGKGRNTLFAILRAEKILRDNNEPYQEFIDRGYFRSIEQKYTKPDGTTCISIKTLVYQRGLEYIKKVLDKQKVS
jgi:anti-repressor protein